MVAVITGDIINSRHSEMKAWMKTLKSTLSLYGDSPKKWEIYRGDSFQIIIPVENAIRVALHLKASIKQFGVLDVRLGIGIGEIDFQSDKVTTSNGTAFVRSGESFDALKKQNIVLKSNLEELDERINIMLGLAMYIADRWTSTVSTVIKTVIENPDLKQQELAERLGKSQSNISEALKRGGFDEIMAMNNYFKTEISKL